MNKLEFKNITIIYNEEDVNKKVCKRKERQMNLWSVMAAILTFVMLFVLLGFTVNLPEALSIIIGLIFMPTLMFGSLFLGYWVIYRNTIKAFSFMEWLFRMKEVHASWYNDKILVRVQHSNGVDDYSLQGFVRTIKNGLTITDKSDRSKPIHIFVDITSNEKTEITIENVEE